MASKEKKTIQTKADPVFSAVQAVHAALKDLQAEERGRVFASVSALLDITGFDRPRDDKHSQKGSGGPPIEEAQHTRTAPSRPVSLVELMQDKKPITNPQKIVLFAYYRERFEGKPRFSRSDLEPYFAKAKESPPGNYIRDFTKTVREGWIHEDDGDSYVTTKGIEAVESGFSGL
ncbi:MAG: hypothetical protein MN733_30815, partial [Nitrososphaera sp.]|nr:hypothetical protein [Nitrososphaera sp.]